MGNGCGGPHHVSLVGTTLQDSNTQQNASSMPPVTTDADACTRLYEDQLDGIATTADHLPPMQVFEHMQEAGVEPDVVTCCSLISALERGGEWQLAEQLFCQMCAAAAGGGEARALLLLRRIGTGQQIPSSAQVSLPSGADFSLMRRRS